MPSFRPLLALAGLLPWACLLAAAPTQQEKVKWIREHAIPVRSVDIAAEDFSDLLPLKQAIGDARIVQLGEATHGDGTTFLAKARLVRFLHEQMGFDVLLWESPMLGARLMDAGMRNPAMSAYDAAHNNIFGIWAESAQVQGLLEYIKQSQATVYPIQTGGVDCRLGYEDQKEKVVPEYLLGFFDRIDPKLLTPPQRAEIFKICKTVEYGDYFKTPGKRDIDISVMKNLVSYLDQHRVPALSAATAEETDFVRQLLLSEIGYETLCNQVGQKVEDGQALSRDMLMGRNLVWQATHRFANRKIVVWAHNYHIMESIYLLNKPEAFEKFEKSSPDAGPMGHVASRKLGKEVYTVGFLGYEGSHAMANTKGAAEEKIPPANKNTLDWYLNQVDAPYSFLDLQSLPANHWLRQPVTARFYFWGENSSLWPRVYDAVFFSKKMEPSTPAK